MLTSVLGRMPERARHPRPRDLGAAVASLALLLAVATTLSAHAVVFPAEAPTGAYQRYTLRVPNERDFPTVRVVITFPSGVRVISFDEVPGWMLETTSAGEGAYAAAAWSGTIPVGRFVEFGFIGVNPGEPTTLEWDVVQTYADGTEVAWTGPPESSTPASVTDVVAPAAATDAPPTSDGTLATWLGGAALVVALLSLGLSLRASKPA
jgi:uncharacterized protein YcnI